MASMFRLEADSRRFVLPANLSKYVRRGLSEMLHLDSFRFEKSVAAIAPIRLAIGFAVFPDIQRPISSRKPDFVELSLERRPILCSLAHLCPPLSKHVLAGETATKPNPDNIWLEVVISRRLVNQGFDGGIP